MMGSFTKSQPITEVPVSSSMTSVKDDEAFKGVCHGLVLGAILLPLAYNVKIKKWRNVIVYAALIGFEVTHVLSHLKDA